MFRDPAYFLALREQVVPLLRTYPSLKIWVAGCSAGEEVYSLAILLREEGLLARTLIYATDINPHRAAEGRGRRLRRSTASPASPRTTAAPARTRSLSDYYTAAYGRAVFDKSLREHIVFSDHSLATDSVFAEVQLVSCRNVLIYFDRALQDRALGLFRDALCRRGFLGLGSKESLRFSSHADAFDELVRDDRIYQKRGRGMKPRSPAAGAAARRRGRRSAPRPAASRRCRCCCRRCRRGLRAAVFVVLHLPRERPSLLAEIFGAQVRAAGARGGGQGAGRSRARSTSRRPTTTCWSTTGRQLVALGRRAGASSRGRRSTCCSSRRPTCTASACSASC